jgi:hypothetical protein
LYISIGKVEKKKENSKIRKFLIYVFRHSMGTVMTELTKNAFITIYRTLNDRDRRVFAIYFAMEVWRNPSFIYI